jgi:single-strand DNA-binding protein
MVTVVGNVVDSPRMVRFDNSAVTNFRMASTARRYDSATQQWVDSGTFWVDVECWNGLSSNVSASITKGDPVIVSGALTTHAWETDDGRRQKPRIKAFAVGPNLARCTAEPKRDRSTRSEAGVPDEVPDVPPVDSPADGDDADYPEAARALYELDSDPEPEPAHA